MQQRSEWGTLTWAVWASNIACIHDGSHPSAYRAKTKGKVERPIRYVRENFFYGREFLNDGDLAEQSYRWLTGTANVRIHQTTKQVPVAHFERDEVSLLLPLAPRSYQSLMLPIERKLAPSAPSGLPRVEVERRPLSRYAAIAGGAL